MKSQIIKLIMNSDITLLTFFSGLIPFGLLVVWAFITDKVFNNQVPQYVHSIVINICISACGLGGLFQVIKREAPGTMGKTIKGTWAVISGTLLMVLFFGGGVILWCLFIVEYIINR